MVNNNKNNKNKNNNSSNALAFGRWPQTTIELAYYAGMVWLECLLCSLGTAAGSI